MKLSRIIDEKLHLALNRLSKEILPLKAAFKLKKIIETVRREFNHYEEVRKEALMKFGEKNEDGTLKLDDRSNVQFSDAGLQGFAQELKELIELDIEVPTIKTSELGNINITLADIESLDGIIIED